MSGTAAPLVASPFHASTALTRRRASLPGSPASRAGRGSALAARARQTCYMLANAMVIGRCDDDASRETLRLMTVADAAATIAACGEIA